MKDIRWSVLPVEGAARGIVVVWREEKVSCKEVIVGEIIISCMFQTCHDEEEWVLGVYIVGGTESKKDSLWREQEEYKKK